MSDAGEVAGFVLEATVEVISALGEVDSGSKRKKRRGAFAILVIIVAVVIGTVLFLVYA